MRFQMVAAVAALAAISACNRAEKDDANRVDSSSGSIATGQSTGAAVASPANPAASVTGFIKAVNDAEVETGTSVEGKATNAEVKAFAKQIVRDHKALQKKVDEYASKHSVTPAPPGTDNPLVQDHQTMMSDLGSKPKGKDYDKQFVSNEVKMHQAALDKVNEALSNATDADLKQLLTMAQGGIQGHLAKAQQLEKKLGG